MSKGYIALFFLTFLLFCSHCRIEKGSNVNVPEKPFEKLSEYGFFTGDIALLNPNERVIPYDLNTPLFSDYAHKARFVWMPENTSASIREDGKIDYPMGTALIKNFFYWKDERDTTLGRKIIETRIIVNRGDEWEAMAYIWNQAQTDAFYEVIGDIQEIDWVNQAGVQMKINYIIPNKNQCKNCHAYDGKLQPVGPKVANLNRDYSYSNGSSNQLARWSEIGFLDNYNPSANYKNMAVWNDSTNYRLHERALAYLDVNCGHCHNPKGAANTSGLTLTADSPLGLPLGVYKATVSAGAGTGGNTYSIVPGHPEESIMIYRMYSTNPGAMMPELGRSVIHNEGVALISDWIRQMDYRSGEAKAVNASLQ